MLGAPRRGASARTVWECVRQAGVRISQWSPTRIRNGFTKRLGNVALPRMLPIAAGDLPLTRLGSSQDARMVPVGSEEGSVCYCVGVGDSVTFDLDLVERGCRVFAFDPTPASIEYMKTIDYDEERLTFERLRRLVGEHDAAVLRASRPREGQLVGRRPAFDRRVLHGRMQDPVDAHGRTRPRPDRPPEARC